MTSNPFEDSPIEAEYHYDYDHNTGAHYLVRNNNTKRQNNGAPRFSWKCCCNYLLDTFCFLLAIGFLVAAIWFAFYELNNADSGGGR
mmetsp:Transcript_9032/g.13152  ORF Transcript_9032/g.13152 Transcript_9032/m.13152 type:complete len:87 (-) Transcript_9032:350-610(-)